MQNAEPEHPYERPSEPDAGVRAAAEGLLRRLTDAAERRTGAARVDDGDDTYEVSVAPGGRWRVMSSRIEWWYGPDGLASAVLTLAGAKPREVTEPEGWIHPAVGLLWPQILPVWGHPGDRYRPVDLLEGTQGPALVELAPTFGETVSGWPLELGGRLYVNAVRALVTRAELGVRSWTLIDVL